MENLKSIREDLEKIRLRELLSAAIELLEEMSCSHGMFTLQQIARIKGGAKELDIYVNNDRIQRIPTTPWVTGDHYLRGKSEGLVLRAEILTAETLNYKWYRNEIPIKGATNKTLNVLEPGDYAVLVIDPVSNGISASESHTVFDNKDVENGLLIAPFKERLKALPEIEKRSCIEFKAPWRPV